MVKASVYNAGDLGSIPGSRISSGEGNGNPLLPGKIPWIEEPGRLQSMGSQRVGHNLATSLTGSTLCYVVRVCSVVSDSLQPHRL